MYQLLKVAAAVVFVAGILASPVARAQQNPEGESAKAGEVGDQKQRTFEETREFMRKHSEESKKTGKM